MKHFYTFMITSFCITIMLLSALTLYRAHENIVDANSTFENFVEIYQASYYREEVIVAFNDSDYVFDVELKGEKQVILMSYKIKVLGNTLDKQIKAELLVKP